eukprot:GEMP01036766.1.p1 GENE.GEMP01036766.1~~GEMP01036766.1.p1  ORF type:complete len:441 (+),score=88.73 GEMP01036766.1:353-1675(+)
MGQHTPWVARRQKNGPMPFATWLDHAHPILNSFEQDVVQKVRRELSFGTYPHLSLEHLLNSKWDMEHLPIFLDTLLRDNPLGLKKRENSPGTAVLHDDVIDARIGVIFREATRRRRSMWNDASMDLRVRESESVVNYRINPRDLFTERLGFFFGAIDGEEDIHHAQGVDDEVLKDAHVNFQIGLLKIDLARRGPLTFDININLDALVNVPRDDIYKVIWNSINAEIERVYSHAPNDNNDEASRTPAMEVLQEIADEETKTRNKYKMFNKMTETAQLRKNKPRDRAWNTYWVHFSDPEGRFVDNVVARELVKSKIWYQSMWKRLFEPILENAIIDGLGDMQLRNIVLVYRDTPGKDRFAYVGNYGRDMIIFCDDADSNHANTDYVIRHEYEHTVENALEQRTRKAYETMEDDADVDTLYHARWRKNSRISRGQNRTCIKRC